MCSYRRSDRPTHIELDSAAALSLTVRPCDRWGIGNTCLALSGKLRSAAYAEPLRLPPRETVRAGGVLPAEVGVLTAKVAVRRGLGNRSVFAG